MHTLIVRTKYALGDRVRFNSPTQRCSGTGKIESIVIRNFGPQEYMIALDEVEDFDIQPGILEDEITLREPADGV